MRTVLVVDDEYGIVDALSELLEEQGYRVLVARNGRDALRRVAESRPDLVLLDFMLPVLDGAGVLRVLREDPSTRELPVVLMTGALREHLPRDCVPTVFLQKPFGAEALLAVVCRLIGGGTPPQA